MVTLFYLCTKFVPNYVCKSSQNQQRVGKAFQKYLIKKVHLRVQNNQIRW